MAIRLNSLFARLVGAVTALHAIALPLLFFGVMYVVGESHRDNFVDHVRDYGRVLADVFESINGDDQRAIDLLDGAMLTGWGVYAELVREDGVVSSTVSKPREGLTFESDLAFGEHDDDVYYLSFPVHSPAGDSVLRLGFDERPTLEQIARVRERLLLVLSLYFLITTALVALLSSLLTQKMKVLQIASRQVASGVHTTRLELDTGIVELSQFANDLDSMRRELVGTNAQLKREISMREEAELKRVQLETQIRQAQKIETIGTFSGGIAHEFNNILTPIIFYAEMLLDDRPDDSTLAHDVGRIHGLALRAKSLVKRILTFSHQGESGKKTRFDVGTVAADALAMLRAVIPSTIRINSDMAAECCDVLGDADEIHQLIVNLCNNAYLAIERGEGEIEVVVEPVIVDAEMAKKRPRLRPGAYVRLTVTDDGVGMDEFVLEHAFEPFYTTRPVGRGTGLGLSVVHGIVLSHGGDIQIRSKPSSGTRVEVYLPAANAETAEVAPTEAGVRGHDKSVDR
jgi:signal transduction histidine kinase